jgi:MFS family permease
MQFHGPVGWYYFYLGLIMGSYIARLPDMKESYHLSNTMLGVVLIFAAIGAISSMPLVLSLNRRYGSAKTLLLGGLWVEIVIPFLGMTQFQLPLLIPSFFFIGCGMALIDVSMTAQVVIIEKKSHKNQMGVYGGTMALGNFVGVLIGGGFAALSVSIRNHFALVSLASLPLVLSSYCFLFSKEEEDSYLFLDRKHMETPAADSEEGLLTEESQLDSSLHSLLPSSSSSSSLNQSLDLTETKSSRPGPSDHHLPAKSWNTLMYLCLFGFLNQICCGSISDWSVVYFHENLSASPLERSFGFAMFSLSSAVGSVLSDLLSKFYPRKSILTVSGLCGILGIGIVYAAQWISFLPIYFASLGLLISGFGLSSIGPVIASAGGDVPGIRPSDAVSSIAALTYLGYLLGPPFFGTIADLLNGVQWGYLFIIAFLLLMISLPGSPPVNKYYSSFPSFSSQIVGQHEAQAAHGNGFDDQSATSSLIAASCCLDDEDDTEEFANSLERLSYPVF